MRVLASADLHGFLDIYRWLVIEARTRDAEVLVLAGDLLTSIGEEGSVEDGMRAAAGAIHSILAECPCPVLYLMGNDDLVDLGDHGPAESIHGRRREVGGFPFVGYAGGPPFLGGPYDRGDDELRRELQALRPLVDGRTVVVTHDPAAGTLDGGGRHGLGARSAISRFLDDGPFLAHLHGHVHHAFGRKGRHFNVASGGRRRAMLIDLPSLDHTPISGGVR